MEKKNLLHHVEDQKKRQIYRALKPHCTPQFKKKGNEKQGGRQPHLLDPVKVGVWG